MPVYRERKGSMPQELLTLSSEAPKKYVRCPHCYSPVPPWLVKSPATAGGVTICPFCGKPLNHAVQGQAEKTGV